MHVEIAHAALKLARAGQGCSVVLQRDRWPWVRRLAAYQELQKRRRPEPEGRQSQNLSPGPAIALFPGLFSG